jgi:hypothetical protein
VNAALDARRSSQHGICRRRCSSSIVHHEYASDKEQIRPRPRIDLVLDMDGFGSRSPKLWTYRMVTRQCALRLPV